MHAFRYEYIANSDIFFDDTLHRVAPSCTGTSTTTSNGSDRTGTRQQPNLHNKILALQKWYGDRLNATALPRITMRVDSQDAWIFQTPVSSAVISASNFFLGQPKCDNRLVSIFRRANYFVSCPAFALRAIEFPYEMPSGVYDTKDAVAGDVSDLLLSDEMEF